MTCKLPRRRRYSGGPGSSAGFFGLEDFAEEAAFVEDFAEVSFVEDLAEEVSFAYLLS
jgi:hypothetical protein